MDFRQTSQQKKLCFLANSIRIINAAWGNLRPRQSRDPKSWEMLPNKQKPIWGLSPASARLMKEAAGGELSFVPLWGRQMGQGNLQLERKASLVPQG